MTAPKKIMLIISLMTMLFLGTYLLIQHFIVVPTFQSLEQQYARDDVDRVETVILDRLDTLERQMFDWSWWDDTYGFVIDANEQYINNNLVGSSFPNLQIDMAYILDVNTRPVWAATYQLSDEGFEVNTRDEYVEESIHLLKQELNKVKFLSDKEAEVTHGIFFQQGLPIAFSIGPILTTNGEGPSRGYLVLGRKLDEFFVEEWGEKIKTPFSIERPDKMLASINDFSSYEYTTEILSKELLTSSKTYQLDGFPVFRINTQFTRKVTQGGLSSLKYTLFYSLLLSILMMLAIAVLLRVSIFSPLSELKRQIQYISKHKDYSLRSLIKSNDEIGVFSNEFNSMLDIIENYTEDLVEANEKIQSVNAKLKQLSLIDPLTKIGNRLSVRNKLQIEWMASYRQKSPLTVMMVDIDYFKTYNDNYGHLNGDKCLVKVAKVLNDNMHRPRDMAARFGGEEFILILPETNRQAALKIARRIQDDIAKCSIEHRHNKVSSLLTISIGVATQISTAEQSVDALVDHADKALYIAKNNGRNRIEVDVELRSSVDAVISHEND